MDTHYNNRAIPESFKVGEQFEDYIRSHIFVKEYYTLVDRTHRYEDNCKDFIESSKNPDFKFRDKANNREFFVEVKFRSKIYDNKLDWCRQDQLARYQQFHTSIPVFIVIGVGGTSVAPDILSLLPLAEAKYPSLYRSRILKFLIPNNLPVMPEKLIELLKY